MKDIFKDNRDAEFCSDVAAASLPFITVGMFGQTIILWISIAIGVMALIGMVLFLIWSNRLKKNESWPVSPGRFFFPYVIVLGSAIVGSHGINADVGYVLGAILFVGALSSTLPAQGKR